jgi:two-component system phosphate regulon sensor histidine kinase PhoR
VARNKYSTQLAIGLVAPALAAGMVALLLRQLDLPGPWWLVGGALAGLFGAWVAHGRLLRPLKHLLADAKRLPDSGKDARISAPGTHEFSVLAEALNRLADRAEDQIGAVEAERAHLLAIVSSMSEGILVVDGTGKVVLVNPHWRQLFGLSKDAEGVTPVELTRQATVEHLISRTLETGEGGQEEIELDQPEQRTVIVTSSALSDRSGTVVVARDITAYLRLAEIRRDFVANVSHELKTPLSAIRGLAETLRDGAVAEVQIAQHFLTRILKQCRRLETLLSDLLTLSRLERLDAAVEREHVDLAEIVHDGVEVLAALARQRLIDVTTRLEGPFELHGNRDALERLTLNLLENAIKYNRPGGQVEVLLQQGEGAVVLTVTDTGIGIPAESLDRLFERFYRVDKGRSRVEGGTGLGLAIVKHAAQLHGGWVEIESKLGHGSTFRVTFPLSDQPEVPDTGPPAATP